MTGNPSLTPGDVLRLLGASLGIAALAVLARLLVALAIVSGPSDVSVGLLVSIAASLVVTAAAAYVAAGRLPASPAASGLLLVFPFLLGFAELFGTGALWFGLVVWALYVGAGLLGIRLSGEPDPVRPAGARRRDELGQGSSEFVGISIVAAILVAALVGALVASSPSIRSSIAAALCRITGGSCEAGGEAADPLDLQPECEVYSQQQSLKAQVDITFVRLGGGVLLQRSENSNGEIDLTIVDQGSAGVVAAIGGHAQVDAGDLGSAGIKREAEVAAEIGLRDGETYTFTDSDQADAFQQYLLRETGEDIATAGNPVMSGANWLFEKVTNEQPPANDGVRKQFTAFDVRAQASGSVSGGFNSEIEGQVQASRALGVETDRGPLADDPSDDTRTYYIETAVGAGGSIDLPAVKGADGQFQSSTIVKLTVDKDNQPTQVQVVNGYGGSFDAGLDAGADPAFGSDPDTDWGIRLKGGENSTTSITRTLEIGSDAERAQLRDWLTSAGGVNALVLADPVSAPFTDPSTGGAVTSLGDSGDAFAERLRNESKVSVVEYDGNQFKVGGGVGVSVGAKGSVDIGYESTDSSAVKAAYLGSPDASGYRPAIDLPSCVR